MCIRDSGTASLPALTEYEQNFTTLCQTLTAYAGQLFELGHTDDARTILEYGISIGSRSEEHTSELQSLRRISYAVRAGRLAVP